MNKELINKYKLEFDHWINEGFILVKYVNKNQAESGYKDWHEDNNVFESNLDYLIIINDEYSEFRKALAEGKVIEYLGQSSNVWHEVPEPDFNLHPTCYRIKPDEPKFKIGDFVRCTSTTSDALPLRITRFVQGNYHVLNSNLSFLGHELEPWTPVKGEWCWLYDIKSVKSAALAQFKEMNNEYFMSITDTSWKYCEPFLNSLPSYLKDK